MGTGQQDVYDFAAKPVIESIIIPLKSLKY